MTTRYQQTQHIVGQERYWTLSKLRDFIALAENHGADEDSSISIEAIPSGYKVASWTEYKLTLPVRA